MLDFSDNCGPFNCQLPRLVDGWSRVIFGGAYQERALGGLYNSPQSFQVNPFQVEAHKGIPRPFYEPGADPHAQGHLRGQEGNGSQ